MATLIKQIIDVNAEKIDEECLNTDKKAPGQGLTIIFGRLAIDENFLSAGFAGMFSCPAHT